MEAGHPHRNRWLDALRGIAIGQVIVWHFVYPGLVKHFPLLGRAFSLTWSGVDLFFVLSGFLIGGILLKNRGAENYYSVFYTRRILRIAPLYIIALCVAVIAFHDTLEWHYLVMGQNIVWASQDAYGPDAMAVTWSLAVEEQFYLCLPLMVALIPAKRFPKVIVALILTAPIVRLLCHFTNHPHAAYLLLPARMDSLFIGVLIAWVTREGRLADLRRISLIAVWPLGLIIAALAIAQLSELGAVMGTIGYTAVALFYGCVLTLAASEKRPVPPIMMPCVWAGLGAYSLYLFHTTLAWGVLSVFGVTWLTAVAFAVASGGVALACWLLIEKPLIEWGHKTFRYRQTGVAQPRVNRLADTLPEPPPA